MILTPISIAELPGLLSRFAANLSGDGVAADVFRRIADTLNAVQDPSLTLSDDLGHHAQAVALCHRFALGTIDESPKAAFTWDGSAVRVGCEPSVVIHEVAHFQCAAPARRSVYDFGLGAGPETGRRAEADAVASVFGLERDQEEIAASLLGILWEVELGQPAILAFLEQNWLEGGDGPTNRAHFLRTLATLHHHGLVDESGRPTENLRQAEDHEKFFP